MEWDEVFSIMIICTLIGLVVVFIVPFFTIGAVIVFSLFLIYLPFALIGALIKFTIDYFKGDKK